MSQPSSAPKIDLSGFQCKRCGNCCRQPGFVYLSEEEALEVARFLNLAAFDFVNRYCEIQDRRHLVLKKREDESCIFLEGNDCRIHPAKPRQCRDFPFTWRTQKSFSYCEGLKTLVSEVNES